MSSAPLAASERGRLSVDDLLSIADLEPADIATIFATTVAMKAEPDRYSQAMQGRSSVLIFEKPSLRTRVTFDLGLHQMGGHAVYLDHLKVKLGERESIKDVARNLERWCDIIIARTYRNRSVTELASQASIPVINGLTDLLHPCQGLTDLFTIREHFGHLDGLKIGYIGDGNNTCHSLINGTAKLGLSMVVVTPEDYEPNSRVANAAVKLGRELGADLQIENDVDALTGCDVIYTDTWTSMGQEFENEERTQVFAPYQVNERLMSIAGPEAIFMHCLPAHRGAEVTTDVIDSDRSLVYEQAENRLHVQKALMTLLVTPGQNTAE